MKKAFITGVNGQDGSYLAELLLKKDYKVFGTIRRNSTKSTETVRIDHILQDIEVDYADVSDSSSINGLISIIRPDEIYHLAAMSDVAVSFKQPAYTIDNITIGTLNILEAARQYCNFSKIYQASTSEIYGNNGVDLQTEDTPMTPVSPYGIAKLAAYNFIKVYRKSYNMFASNGILFNHESPRRGENFVTAKIIKAAIEHSRGRQEKLLLGSLDSTRDWGHAKDYVNAMYLILQHERPDDFVCATGISHSVRDVCQYVYDKLELGDFKKFVDFDEYYNRPNDLVYLRGDSRKAEKVLGWKREYTFETLLNEMIEERIAKI